MFETSTSAAAWREHPSYGEGAPLDLVNDSVGCTRLVVVSAHPDDESLGAGGLIATAAAAGLAVYVVLLTAGEASPHASPTSTRHALATLRLAEMENALARLAPDHFMVFLGAPDGAVSQSEAQIAQSLTELVGDGSSTLLAAPWREDQHPDHAAAGRAAAVAANASGARLVEYPLMSWAVTSPDDLPWDDVRQLDLPPEVREVKAAAIRAHTSQVRAAGGGAGAEAPLPGRVIAHFEGDLELYLEASAEDAATPDASTCASMSATSCERVSSEA